MRKVLEGKGTGGRKFGGWRDQPATMLCAHFRAPAFLSEELPTDLETRSIYERSTLWHPEKIHKSTAGAVNRRQLLQPQSEPITNNTSTSQLQISRDLMHADLPAVSMKMNHTSSFQ